jgi:dTDP-4-amino-4,6-dideoxygalactose transaminase
LSNPYHIPFHKPTLIGGEEHAVLKAIHEGVWAKESSESHQFFENRFPGSKCFFTNSCSAALEIAVRSLNPGPGDEIMIPGYAYLAVANAVVNNGARPVYADVLPNGNIDVTSVAQNLSPKTKAVIAIHYAGNPFDINALWDLCEKNGIYLIEDAAQCIGSSYNSKPLGSTGHLACFSFDYMKNVTCGQGGLLIVNDKSLLSKVQTVYDNGSNRHDMLSQSRSFFDWAGKGNNARINPLSTYFLSAQLNALKEITETRLTNWNLYKQLLQPLEAAGKLHLPQPAEKHNGHIFYVITPDPNQRNRLRTYLREREIFCEHHYSSLAGSPYGRQFRNAGNALPNSEMLCHNLLRLPLHHQITAEEIEIVATGIESFYVKQLV